MTTRSWIAGGSLLVGMALGWGMWHGAAVARQQERRSVWLEYLRGPLRLYTDGIRRGPALLAQRTWTPAQKRELEGASQAVRAARDQAEAHAQEYQADAFFSDLVGASLRHDEAGRQAEAWVALTQGTPSARAQALSAIAEVKRNLVQAASRQWDRVEQEVPLEPAEKAESEQGLAALVTP